VSSSDIETVRLIVRDELAKNGNGKEPEQDPHTALQKNLPTGFNFAKCEGADCGHVKLQNSKQIGSWKSCPGCKNNIVPNDFDYCPNCGIEDRNDKDFWDNSDVEIGEDV